MDWIETLFGWDPDHGNGLFELALLATPVLAAVLVRVGVRLRVKRHVR